MISTTTSAEETEPFMKCWNRLPRCGVSVVRVLFYIRHEPVEKLKACSWFGYRAYETLAVAH